MLKKGFLSSPKQQGHRPPLKEEEESKASSPKLGNGPLSKEDNGKDSSPKQGNQPLSKEGNCVVCSPKQRNPPLSMEEKGKAPSFKQGNRPLSKKGKGKASSFKLGNRRFPKKGKGKNLARTVGKGGTKGYPTSSWPWDQLSLMDPIERALVLESLADDSPWDDYCSFDPIERALFLESLDDDSPWDDFCSFDPIERALFMESLDDDSPWDDFCSFDPIERALFMESFDYDSEFSSTGGESSPDSICKELEREFDRNFEREIDKAIADKSKNGLDLLDVEIFKSMLGKPSWIDTDDFKQRFPHIAEGMQGDVDDGLRLEMLRYLESIHNMDETQSVDAHSHTTVKSTGSSGKDSLQDELGMMGAGFIPVVEHDEGMVKDNNTRLEDIRSLQLHSNSNNGYSKAKTKTQGPRPDPMDEAKAAVDFGKTLGVDFHGQEDFWVKKIAEMEIKEREEYDALRKGKE